MFSYAYLFKPRLLLLDEPDSHLHPNNQISLLENLEQLISLESQMKIIMTTHSRYMLNSSSEVVWLESGVKKEPQANIIISALMGIGALDSFGTLDSAKQKLVIITEDKDTKYLKKILDVNDIKPEIYGKTIFSSNGSSTPDAIHAFLQSISGITPDKFLVILDRDAYTDEELSQRKEVLEKSGVTVVFNEFYDVEASFCHSKELVAEFYGINVEEVGLKIEELLNKNKEKFIKNWVNARVDACNKMKQKPNHGEIAVNATNLWDKEREKLIKGKDLLALINTNMGKRNLYTEAKKQHNIFQSLVDIINEKVS